MRRSVFHTFAVLRLSIWAAWSLLLRRVLTVCLHRFAPGLDTGEIFLTWPVALDAGGALEVLFWKCQATTLDMYREFLADPVRFTTHPYPNKGGKTYFAMNRQLKALVEDLVLSGVIS